MTVKICVLCGPWFSTQFEIVSETPLSSYTVGLELKWAVLRCALKPTGTFASESKVMCFYLLILEVIFWCFALPTSVSISTITEWYFEWYFDVSHCRHQSVYQQLLRLRKAEFINWIDLINVLLIGFVKFEIKQWFSAFQCQFCAWLSLARQPTARVFFLSHFLRMKRLHLSSSC